MGKRSVPRLKFVEMLPEEVPCEISVGEARRGDVIDHPRAVLLSDQRALKSRFNSWQEASILTQKE